LRAMSWTSSARWATAAEELVTVLAHDLRNLLAPLHARVHLVHRRAEVDGRREDVADLQAAQQAVSRLGNLVSDILDVARIDQGLFHGVPRPVDLAALVEDTARTLTSPSHPVEVREEATGTLLVSGDERRLRQCVENLVINAIQKSPRDAPVNVSISSETRESGEWALVEVLDQGPGVPGHLLPHVFERFTTESRSHREGGLGLGLYLAKQIAGMHGGDLTVDSTPGMGARFTLALPCHAER
jgi:two-component system, OmpR family, sensor kinase